MSNDHESVERVLKAIYALTTAVNNQTETIADCIGDLRDAQKETQHVLEGMSGVINAGEMAFDVAKILSGVTYIAEEFRR